MKTKQSFKKTDHCKTHDKWIETVKEYEKTYGKAIKTVCKHGEPLAYINETINGIQGLTKIKCCKECFTKDLNKYIRLKSESKKTKPAIQDFSNINLN